MIETQTAIPEPTTDCSDCNDSAIVESAARELYQTAALFVGDENEAIQLVEQTVDAVEMDPCSDGEAAREAASQRSGPASLGPRGRSATCPDASFGGIGSGRMR